MLAGQLVEPGRFEVVEVGAPVPAEGQVLLDSYRTSICGSDLHLVYKGMYRGEYPAPPGWPGHEGVGTVLESRDADDALPGAHLERAWAAITQTPLPLRTKSLIMNGSAGMNRAPDRL